MDVIDVLATGHDPDVDPDAKTPEWELDDRRRRVVQMRLRKLTQVDIAKALGIEQRTVSRDLAWVRKHWRDVYGVPVQVNPAEEIGEAVAVYEGIEVSALRDYSRLGVEETGTKLACLRTAMVARKMRLSVLAEFGILERSAIPVQMNLPRADDIRSMLREHGLLGSSRNQLVEHTLSATPDEDDVVAQWLARGE